MTLFKQILVLVIIFQLSFSQALAQSLPPTGPGDESTSSEIENLAVETYKSPEDRAVFNEINGVADAIEKGQIPESIEKTNPDIFHLGNQRVQILNRGTVVKEFSVNEVRANYETLAASNLRPIYNPETRELAIEGVNGIKADGTGGDIVARHIIPDLDIISLKYSNELLVFMNSRGEVGMIDMGFVAKQVFKNPLYVVDHVWRPTKPIKSLNQVDIRFMTPGTDPLTMDAYKNGEIYSRDEKGEPRWLNGDVRITSVNESGQKEVITLIPRLHFYMRGELAAAMILSKLALVDPSAKTHEFMQQVVEKAEKSQIDTTNIPGGYDDILRRFVQNIEPDQVADLRASAGALSSYSKRRFGVQNLSEAVDQFEELRANYAKKPGAFDDVDELERRWYENVTPVTAESPFRRNFSDVLSTIVQKTTSLKAIGIMFTVASVAYIGFPFAYEHFEALQQIKILNWFYLNGLPEVLNQPYTFIPREVDGVMIMEYVNYRKYMILNMIALVMLWPAAHVTAFSFKKALNMTYSVVKESNTRFATFIREMHKNWSPLTNWQVVTSFGMRVYSWFIYPVVRFGIQQLARQKSFFVATGNYQNPFQVVRKDSEIGQKLGLDRSLMVGVNNPLVGSDRLKADTELRLKAQALLKEQNMRKSQMAFLLSTLTVSEKYGIDPATLIQLGNGNLKLEDLGKVFSDERRKKEWFLTAKLVYEMLQRDKSEIKEAIDQMPQAEYEELYKKAKAVAEQVHSRSDARLAASTLWTRFKRAPFWLLNNMPFISGGMNDYKFLNTIYTNKFVSDQVHKQFYIDHLMVVGIVALMPGEAGRANYAKPQNLAADPKGILWSTGPHLNDTVMNTYIHFFVSGAKTAMVYQSIKAQADSLPERKESGVGYEDPSRNNLVYDPMEDFKYLTAEREQGFLGSTYDWTKSLLTFTESQLGEYMWKTMKRRLTTLQGGFLTFMIFQMAFIENRLFSDALMAFGLMFSAAYWRYAWPWDPVQRGNSMIDERFAEKRESLNIAKENLLDAMKYADSDSSNQKIRVAYRQLLGLFVKENPGVLSRLKKVSSLMADQKTKTDLQEKLNTLRSQVQKISDLAKSDKNKEELAREIELLAKSDSMYYYGLLAKLSAAHKGGDKAAEELYRSAILKILNGEANRDLYKLSSQGLFDLALAHSPVYTKPSSVLSAFTTLGAAIGTTVLALSLMTETTDVVDKPTLQYVTAWTIANFVGFGVAYLATGARPWKFYLSKWESLKNKFKNSNVAVAADTNGAVSCEGYFR